MRLSLTCTYQRQRSCMPIACRVPQRAKIVMCLTLHADPTIQYNYHTSPYLCHIFVLLCSAISVTSTGFSPPSMRKLPYDTTWWEIHYSLHTPYWKSWWKKIKNRPVSFEALFISLSLLMPFLSTYSHPSPVSHCGTSHQLSDDAWTQQWQETHGYQDRETLVWDYQPPH